MRLMIFKFWLIVIIASQDLFSLETNFNINLSNVDTNATYSSFMLDSLPRFIGGNDSLQNVILNVVKKPYINIGYEGVVVFCLTIDRNGILRSIFIPGETENNIFNEVATVLNSKLKNWEPGKLYNKKVNSILCFPVVFIFR